MVRIGLSAAEHSSEVTVEQQVAATHLIRVLRDECGIPAHQIHWDDTIVVRPPGLPSASAGRPNLSASIMPQ
jgi:hypothetical protein